MKIAEISVGQLNELRNADQDSGQNVFILDVRSQDEYNAANIDADMLIPLNELPASVDRLVKHKDDHVVIMCRSGSRSAQACAFLMQNGFTNVANLRGGIRAWSAEIDPTVRVS